MLQTIEERFWTKVDKTNGCWLWIAQRNNMGYGVFRVGSLLDDSRRHVLAHRFAFEQMVGPIEPGLTLDHLCRNPACVNPVHLQAVTQRDNLLRGISFSALNARVTHCPAGHSYDLLNTYISKRGSRNCRICHRQRVAERKRRGHP